MATTTITASVLVGPKQLVLQTREIAPPQPNEVQVKMKATTLCGSDLHYYTHFRNGDFIVREPLSLGHEAAGIIVAVGNEVSDFAIGDRVAIEVGISCLLCEFCLQGRYNLCSRMQFRSSAKSFPHFQGTLQDRINHPAMLCHKLPASISYSQAALIEPLSVAIHAGRRARVEPGMRVLVLGAGAVGLFCAAIAKVSGASTVVVGDIAAARVDFAVANGFATGGYTVPVPATTASTIDEKLADARTTADAMLALDDGAAGHFDVVFECTGVESCVQSGIYAAKSGGKVMLVGMGSPVQSLHLSAAAVREVDLLGVFRYANVYATAIRLLVEKRIPVFDRLVTHEFSGLESVDDAFKVAGRTVDDEGRLVLKTVITY
ncbi:chaperonin 10-like protein [Limtongia smithiae]|uniref:chaperonin 10-like protein n=1 Tax=Limtongia smithiae TaxID=1125753 RepID=UPI0034CF860B